MILLILVIPASCESDSYSLVAGEKVVIGNYEISPIKIDCNSSRVWLECQKNGNYVDGRSVFENKTWLSESGVCIHVDEVSMGQTEPVVHLSISLPVLDVLVEGPDPEFELSADGSEKLTFSVMNNGSASVDEVHLIVSVSPGLEIESYSSTAADMNFSLSHMGDEISDIDNTTKTSRSDHLDVWKSFDVNESQEISVVVKRICCGEHFVYYRTTSGNEYSFIRYPESGQFTDYQGYYSNRITAQPLISWGGGMTLKSTFAARPPVIDGVISSGEWNKVSFGLDNTGDEFIESMFGYVMNDEEYLYVAVVVPDLEAPESTYEDATPGDIVSYVLEVMVLDPISGIQDVKTLVSSINTHSYYTDYSYKTPTEEEIEEKIMSGETIYEEYLGDEVLNGEGVVRFSENEDALDYTFEFKIPLNSSDPLDIVIGEDDTDLCITFYEMFNASSGGLMCEPVVSWPSYSVYAFNDAHLVLEGVTQEDELPSVDTELPLSSDAPQLPDAGDKSPLSNDDQSPSERSTPGFGSIEGLFVICVLTMLVPGKRS